MPRLHLYFPRPLGMRFRTKSNFSNCQPQCTKKTKKRESESLASSWVLWLQNMWVFEIRENFFCWRDIPRWAAQMSKIMEASYEMRSLRAKLTLFSFYLSTGDNGCCPGRRLIFLLLQGGPQHQNWQCEGHASPACRRKGESQHIESLCGTRLQYNISDQSSTFEAHNWVRGGAGWCPWYFQTAAGYSSVLWGDLFYVKTLIHLQKKVHTLTTSSGEQGGHWWGWESSSLCCGQRPQRTCQDSSAVWVSFILDD